MSGDVTLDLNGFAVLGAPSSFTGILVGGNYTNISIRNGSVSGWSKHGINAVNGWAPSNVLIEGVATANNVVSGITASYSSIIRNCLSRNIGTGIACTRGLVSGCTVSGGTIGIEATQSVVRDCHVEGSLTEGIRASDGSNVSHCTVVESTGRGFSISASVLSDSYSHFAGLSGIYVVGAGSQILRNTCKYNNILSSANEAGIYISGGVNRIDGNHVLLSGPTGGIKIPTLGGNINNVVVRNTVDGSSSNNYVGTAGNDFGPIGTAATATSPWANIAH